MTTLPIPIDDYPSNTSTTGFLAVGKPVRATFDYGFYSSVDSDWFKVLLNAGETYVFSMSKVTLTNFNNTVLALRDAAGQEITSRAGLGLNGPSFEFTATTSGTYFIDARSLPGFYGGGQHGYQVNMDLKPAGDDYAASSATTGTGTLGVEKTAVHDTAGDADWFAYTFEAGKTYSLSPSAANGALVELSVVNSSGVVVAAPGSAFKPTESGKYFVVATAFKAGNYAFTVAQATDDHGSDATTTSKLSQGGTVNASLNYIGDQDWFKVSLEADTFYTFELDLNSPAAGEAIKLLLMKPDGSSTDYIRTTNAEGKAVMMVRVATAGDYFANVSYGTYSSGEVAEQYTLKWSATAVLDDAGDTEQTAKAAVVGTPSTGELTGQQDKDIYKLTLSKGVTYSFAIAGADAAKISTEIHDSTGMYMAYGYDNATYHFTPVSDGVYTVHIVPRGSETERLQYTLNTSIAADDYAANAQGAGKVAVGSSIKGSLLQGGGDRDWIGIDMVAGQTYWLTLSNDGSPTGFGTAQGQLIDANGNVLGSSSPYAYYDGFNLPTLALTPKVSGTYYYEVLSYSGLYGNYKLTASQGTPDDAGNRASEAAQLTNNTARTGVLEVATDIDFFQVKPDANSTYVVTLERGDSTSIYNYEMRFFNAAGNDVYVTSYHISGNTRYYTFDRGTEVAYASVTGQGAPNGATYKIKAYGVADDIAGNIQTTAAVAVGGTATGTLEVPGDRDYFKVRLEAGIKYVIDLYGAAGGGGTLNASDFNLLSLVDPSGYGTLPATWRPTGEARMEITPSASGDYYVAIGAQYNAQPLTGSYRVAVSQVSGDVAAPTLGQGLPATATPAGSLYLGFNEQVQVDGSAFSIKDSTGQHVLTPLQLSVSALHHVVTVDPFQFLQPGRTYTLEVAAGGVRDLAGNAYTGQSKWTFTTPAASPAPTSGNDILVSAGKGSMIDGGAGLDTLFMPGSRYDYQLFKLADGRIQVQPPNGAASEVLSNIERIYFNDHAVALDINGNGGQAYRLYRAAFDRVPDSVGVGYWTGQLDKGMSAKVVADAFLTSTEFVGRYGNSTSNAEFVNLLYQNVLHRSGDAAGITYWNNLLDSGYSRAETLLGFSDSPENQSIVAGLIGAGFNFTPI